MHRLQQQQTDDEQHEQSTCSKKLKLDEKDDNMNERQNLPVKLFFIWCYLLIDTRIFQEIIDLIGRCPEFSSKVRFVHDVESKKDVSHLLNLSCLCCDWTKIFWTCSEVEKPKDARENRGRSGFDINTRVIIAFREIGFTALKSFCGFMNIPPPMTQQSFCGFMNIPPPMTQQSFGGFMNIPPPMTQQSFGGSMNIPPPMTQQSFGGPMNIPPPMTQQSFGGSMNIPPPMTQQSFGGSMNIPPPMTQQSFGGSMNIPPPMTQQSFGDIQDNNVISSYKQAAEDNMKNAAAELQHGTDEIVNTAISTDGTWQRRGFSSLNGAVTIIDNSNGKCIDYCVKTKNCLAFKLWKNKTGPKAEKFRKTHKCLLNRTGASGMMESDGILDCFKSSMETRKLRYLTYIGDGDTKSFLNVVNADSYPGYTIKKSECVGHVQKRCGKKLLQFKSTCKDMMPAEYHDDKKDNKQKKLIFYLTHKTYKHFAELLWDCNKIKCQNFH